jgi:hypothetical protein
MTVGTHPTDKPTPEPKINAKLPSALVKKTIENHRILYYITKDWLNGLYLNYIW